MDLIMVNKGQLDPLQTNPMGLRNTWNLKKQRHLPLRRTWLMSFVWNHKYLFLMKKYLKCATVSIYSFE